MQSQDRRRMTYQDRIREIVPDADPRHIEAYMRLEKGTLDAMSQSEFRREALIAKDCIDEGGIEMAERLAKSYAL